MNKMGSISYLLHSFNHNEKISKTAKYMTDNYNIITYMH